MEYRVPVGEGSLESCSRPILWGSTYFLRCGPASPAETSSQISTSSCSNIPEGEKVCASVRRERSLYSSGASVGTSPQEHISLSAGPCGCQTRIVIKPG